VQAPKLTCFSGQKATVECMDREAFVTGVKQEKDPNGRPFFVPKTTTVSTGFQVTLQPAASADRTQVTMNLGICVSRQDANRTQPTSDPLVSNDGKPAAPTQIVQQPRVSTFQAETSFRVPDGKTVLLSGWTHQREAHNDTVPRLAAIPYVGQLFRQIGMPGCVTKQKDHLLVLVTPRIIVNEEKEEKKAEVSAEQEEKAPPKSPCSQVVPQCPRGEALPPIGSGCVAPNPPSSQPAYSNSRTLSLAYEVGNVGPSKLAGIDVYYTHDGGPWQRYPESVRPTGSVPVTVAKDGRYGFTLIARSHAGLARPAPKAGDEPQLWVEVDTTAPEVHLAAPEVSDRHAGVIHLRWKATDRNLGENPVELGWSESPSGPWNRIAASQRAEGVWAWSPPEGAPAQVYFRVLAADRAGNVGAAVTAEPVAIDTKVPEVRGVRLQQAP
jgi:hypothetical protein